MERFIVMEQSEIQITENIKLKINEAVIFPDRFDGLRTWEAGIIFTRYLEKNREILSDKKILELGCGVGITSIFINNYCQFKQLIINDYNSKVIQNAEFNLKNNEIQNKNKNVQFLQFDWSKFEKDFVLQQLLQNLDLVIASDIIYDGTPFQDLLYIVNKCLVKNGKFIVQISTDRFKKDQFIQIILSSKQFQLETILLNSNDYQRLPAIQNEKENSYRFPGLNSLQFQILIFLKLE